MYSNHLLVAFKDLLEDISNIANIIIALVNLILAGYVFVYQQKKDQDSDIETQKQLEQNIRLRWFRELIIQPNLKGIDNFHEELHQISVDVENSPGGTDFTGKYDLIKSHSYKIRRNFIELIRKIDSELHTKISDDFDELIDELAILLLNNDPNINNLGAEISKCITNWHNSLVSHIYMYRSQ